MLKPGDNVDSWCGACKLILAHTIESIAADGPARVSCNTCNALHKYRPHKPGEGPKRVRQRETAASGRSQPRKTRSNIYQKLLIGKDMALAKRYSPKDRYVLDDVVDHPTFGVGVTTTIKDGNKFEIVFEDGMKTLIHGR